MSEYVQIHATSIVLAQAARPFGGPEDAAVLLLGESGSGKSDVALRLIAAGAKLISDDQTRLSSDGRFLYAEAEPSMAGFMEVRNVGIVKLDYVPKARVALVVQLDPSGKLARRPEAAFFVPPAVLSVLSPPALLSLNPFEGSAPEKVAAACAAAVLGQLGANVAP